MSLELSALRPADAEQLVALARAFHNEDGHPLAPAGEAALRTLCVGEPMARGWLACRSCDIVGYAVVTFGFSIEHGGRDGFVDDLYLVPAARGLGLGRMLLDLVVGEARANGVRVLHLEVEPSNARAEKLYRRNGFLEAGRRLMSRRLTG